MNHAVLDFETEMARLRRSFHSGLPARITDLKRVWRTAAPFDVRLAHLERMAHALAGTATAYGLGSLGLAARALEVFARSAQARRATEDAAVQLHVEAMLSAMTILSVERPLQEEEEEEAFHDPAA